jgi:GxxExxY protein
MNHKGHEEHQAHLPIPPTTEKIVHDVIGAAIDVHRGLGPGFIESVYCRAMRVELAHRRLRSEGEKAVQVHYRGELVCHHRLDLLVEGLVIVEVKAVRKLRPIHDAQVLSYLKASGCRVGLLMNFNVTKLLDGLRRFVR